MVGSSEQEDRMKTSQHTPEPLIKILDQAQKGEGKSAGFLTVALDQFLGLMSAKKWKACTWPRKKAS